MHAQSLYSILCVLITILVTGYAVLLLLTAVRRKRPELRLEVPVFVALIVRVLSATAVSLTSFGASLRGTDELVFLSAARHLAGGQVNNPAHSSYVSGDLHVQFIALEMRTLGLGIPDLALRISQVGFTVLGLTLVAAAVHDLAGPRAAVVTAWILAFEPTSIFFSGVIHKEPLLVLAEGLVVFGGAQMWVRPRLSALTWLAAGCGIALGLRPYIGWFLIAASAAVILHASLRRRVRGRTSLQSSALIAGVLLLIGFSAPVIYHASSSQNLKDRLQGTQDANAEDDSNLKLERVDYSTRGNVVVNLPRRVRDVLFRPYPWQLGNLSQRLGLLGTLVTLMTLFLFARTLAERRGQIAARAAPILYPAVFMLIAYSLSAGNAGTAFRYRTHVLALGIAAVAAMRLSRGWAADPRYVRTGEGAKVAPAYGGPVQSRL